MKYSHMPFFINEHFGYFCVADEYKQYQNVNYMPWKLVSGNLENYEEVEFPHEPRSPFHVHCSPIFVNDILSLSYNSNVYIKNGNVWEIVKEKVWQGFFDGEFTNYVHSNKAFIKNKEIIFSLFEKNYRIAPFNENYIITGQLPTSEIKSIIVNTDGDFLGEIQDSFGNYVYKCNIIDDTLYHSVKKIENGIWNSENYEIQKTNNFIIKL